MKRITTLIFILSFFHMSFGQDYPPFPDSGAVWVNAHYTEEELPDEGIYIFVLDGINGFCNNGEDTLIGGVEYSIIKHCNGTYKGALRQESGKVYYVPHDSLSAFLLYDFSVESGEVIEGVYVEDFDGSSAEIQDVEVINVDTITVGGIARRRVRLGFGYWIEGIGSTFGLFMKHEEVYGEMLQLDCMSHNEVIYFEGDVGMVAISGTCQWDLGINENPSLNKELLAYPNPSQSIFMVDIPVKLKSTESLIITNILGEMIEPIVQNVDGGIQIDLSLYADGIYMFNLILEDVQYTAVLMKKT